MSRLKVAERAGFAEKQIKSLILSRESIKNKSPVVAAEFSVGRGVRRVDLAVLDHELTGFEIKSHFDSLARLDRQSAEFLKHFDRVILVAAEKHVTRALQICPISVGIWAVNMAGSIYTIRNAAKNCLRPTDLASLLTKAEQRRLLRSTDHEEISDMTTRKVRSAVQEAFRSRYSAASTKFWQAADDGVIAPESLAILSRFSAAREAVAHREIENLRYWAEWNATASAIFERTRSSLE